MMANQAKQTSGSNALAAVLRNAVTEVTMLFYHKDELWFYDGTIVDATGSQQIGIAFADESATTLVPASVIEQNYGTFRLHGWVEGRMVLLYP